MPALVVKTTHEQYPELMKREIGEAARSRNRAMAEFWHERMLPDHFSPAARYRYGYAPRTKKYLIRKMKLAAQGKALDGGAIDLVLTGRARRMITQVQPLIRAFPTRARVTIFTPSYFTDRPRDPRRPNMGKEVTTVVADQERALAGRGDQVFNQTAQKIRASKTVITK